MVHKMMKRVLVIDDEVNLVSLVKAYLEKDGYQVFTAADGLEGLLTYHRARPDLIILDRMMPEMDGIEFLRQLRKESNTPVIFLTARVEEEDRVLGLELGADDYLVKPFFPRELISRVRAVLRREMKKEDSIPVLSGCGITMNETSHSVTVDGAFIDLTPSEFDLLKTLLANPGKTISRLDLLEAVQGTRYDGYERTIDLHIKNLRAKLAQVNPLEYIITVYGVGYRFRREGE
jgi:DNA-binding response OmpR family regulator